MTAVQINTILGLGILFFVGTISLLFVRSVKKPAVAKKEVLIQNSVVMD